MIPFLIRARFPNGQKPSISPRPQAWLSGSAFPEQARSFMVCRTDRDVGCSANEWRLGR